MSLQPCTIIIFGATGDLAKRKLFPALTAIKKDLHPNTKIIAIGRRALAFDEIKLPNVDYLIMDFDKKESYQDLKNKLTQIEKTTGVQNRLFYFATSPDAFKTITTNLKLSKLAEKNPKHKWHRLMYEKPFGHDLKSAISLNKHITNLFDERQIYRIDHYLAKGFVNEILVLRLSNLIFEQLWNHKHIESVNITIAEKLGVGSRGGYYENAGALRDMLQNHLLQLVAITAMEAPKSLDADSIRNEKVKVLKKIKKESALQLRKHLVLGQYTAGTIDGVQIPDYTNEQGIAKNSTTETYIQLTAYVNNSRWNKVPFHIKTGKALNDSYAEITLVFKQSPCMLFCGLDGHLAPNELTIRIQPNEGIQFNFNLADKVGDAIVKRQTMVFTHASEFGINTKEAYEVLISEAIQGDQTMFTRWDEVETCWKIVDNIHAAKIPITKYVAGTNGPVKKAVKK